MSMFRAMNGQLSDASFDLGDSAMRAGIATITDMSIEDLTLYEHPVESGLFRRAANDYPWTNPRNFTRDQMLPLVAAMSKQGMYSTIRRFFWQRAKRLFFMQNTERDVTGSTKYPWPHKIKPYSESNPDQPEEIRNFDFADPLLPHHVWHIVKAGKMYALYPIAIIGIPLYLLELFFHGRSKTKDEENQALAMAYVNGAWAMKLYKRWGFSQDVSFRYWNSRNEVEYHEATMELLDL